MCIIKKVILCYVALCDTHVSHKHDTTYDDIQTYADQLHHNAEFSVRNDNTKSSI